MPNVDFSRGVFDTIAARFAGRVSDIALFTATRFSFEEWLNWEAFAGCKAVDSWQVHAKPRYCNLGAAGCKDFGDLLVVENHKTLLVEIGLVHDGTGNKWRDKLEWDVQKLARPLTDIFSLHVIVLVSSSSIDASQSWQRWLRTVGCWGRPNPFRAVVRLPPKGQMIVQGWPGRCGDSAISAATTM
jgi:hypothetical protein